MGDAMTRSGALRSICCWSATGGVCRRMKNPQGEGTNGVLGFLPLGKTMERAGGYLPKVRILIVPKPFGVVTTSYSVPGIVIIHGHRLERNVLLGFCMIRLVAYGQDLRGGISLYLHCLWSDILFLLHSSYSLRYDNFFTIHHVEPCSQTDRLRFSHAKRSAAHGDTRGADHRERGPA